jgi:hypothetical protein
MYAHERGKDHTFHGTRAFPFIYVPLIFVPRGKGRKNQPPATQILTDGRIKERDFALCPWRIRILLL